MICVDSTRKYHELGSYKVDSICEIYPCRVGIIVKVQLEERNKASLILETKNDFGKAALSRVEMNIFPEGKNAWRTIFLDNLLFEDQRELKLHYFIMKHGLFEFQIEEVKQISTSSKWQ